MLDNLGYGIDLPVVDSDEVGEGDFINEMNSHPEYLFVRRAVLGAMDYAMNAYEDRVLDEMWVSFDFDKRVYSLHEEVDGGVSMFLVEPLLTDDEVYDVVCNVLRVLMLTGRIQEI